MSTSFMKIATLLTVVERRFEQLCRLRNATIDDMVQFVVEVLGNEFREERRGRVHLLRRLEYGRISGCDGADLVPRSCLTTLRVSENRRTYERREEHDDRPVEGRDDEHDTFRLYPNLGTHGPEAEAEISLARRGPFLAVVVRGLDVDVRPREVDASVLPNSTRVNVSAGVRVTRRVRGRRGTYNSVSRKWRPMSSWTAFLKRSSWSLSIHPTCAICSLRNAMDLVFPDRKAARARAWICSSCS